MGKAAIRMLAAAAMAVACGTACAGDALVVPHAAHPWTLRDRIFFFGGFDAARDSGFVWAGLAGSPHGLLHEDGVRLRITGGAGRYRYRAAAVPGGINEVDMASGELMLGFRRSFGTAAMTGYVGGHIERQDLRILDPGHRAAGTAVGAKAAFEYFNRPSNQWLLSGSAAVSSVHRGYHARIGLAHEWTPGLSLGIEAAVQGNAQYFEPRAGLFTYRTFGRTSFALAGGWLRNSDRGSGAYGSLSVYAPY